MDVETIISSTGDAAVVIDDRRRVVALNSAAERLLGVRSRDVAGKACYEVFCGEDPFGNRFCHAKCIVGVMAERGEPIHYFEMMVAARPGDRVRVGVNTLIVPDRDPGRFHLVHMMTPVTAKNRPEAVPGPRESIADPGFDLTRRETEVLRLLARGKGCDEIAEFFFISILTVRNHVQRILRKMDVHSQLEAVALARRANLV